MAISIKFIPEIDNTDFVESCAEYTDIWQINGAQIIEKLESISGLKFRDTRIEAILIDGISKSGRSVTDPMKLRYNYPKEVKLGTLIHELGHRLMFGVTGLEDLDEHQKLNLFLYDAWIDLYGKDYADKQVEVESNRQGFYDYKKTWSWTLELSREERQQLLSKMIQN